MDKNRLMAAATVVDAQATEFPDLGIPVDPDVADFMNAMRGCHSPGNSGFDVVGIH